MADLAALLSTWSLMPRGRQPAALEALIRALPPEDEGESWNTRFGEDSLYAAWSQTRLVGGIYAANARVVRALLAERGRLHITEIGGGNGALWRLALAPGDAVRITVIDPSAEAGEAVRTAVPAGVEVEVRSQPVEASEIPASDLVVASLVLHHIAGEDAAHRAQHGLGGPGKLEVLRAVRAAITSTNGVLLLNEADVYCDLDLARGEPLLRERLVDSYVRRCAFALLDDVAACPDPSLRARWLRIVRRWCLEQPRVADAPPADRDVYELDVPRWRSLLGRAGFQVQSCETTDDRALFYRYVCVAASEVPESADRGRGR